MMHPTPPVRSRSWPSSDDTTFFAMPVILGGVGVYGYLAWTHYHAEISRGFALVAHWHIRLIQHVSGAYDSLDRQLLTADYGRVTLAGIYAAATSIGISFRIPAAALLGSLALICLIRAPSTRYTRRLDLDGLIAVQAPFFRTIAAFAARRLRLRELRPGEPRPADPALQPHEWLDRYAIVDGKLKLPALRAELTRHLGDRWRGPQGAPPHVRVLFAAFALHLGQRRQDALSLLGDLSEALRPAGAEGDTGPEAPMELKGPVVAHADTIIASAACATAAAHAGRHAFTTPALMTVLVEARRRGGVLPPAAFNAVKLVDRRFWYALQSLGFPSEAHGRTHHPNACVEALGARDHWAVECELGRPVTTPAIDRAVAAFLARHSPPGLGHGPAPQGASAA